MHEPMTLEEAATALNRSVRTVQRMVASGKLRAEERDGRTMVLVERPAEPVVAQLREQADGAVRVAALTAMTGERTALAYQELTTALERRVDEERRAARGWRWGAAVAAAVAVASLVTMSWMAGDRGATRDTLTDTRARLDRAEAAQRALERQLAGVTRNDMLAQNDTHEPGALILRAP
jgi:excisionase family DNA binding protein